MSELWLVLVLAAVSAVAGVVQGATGSGYGIVAAPPLLLLDARTVPGPLLVATIAVMALVTLRHRRSLAAEDLGGLVLGLIPGLAAGALLGAVVSGRMVALLAGLVVLAAVVASLSGARLPFTRATALASGGIAGILTVLVGTPGPAVTIVYPTPSPDRTRATLSLFFLVASAAALAPLALVPPAPWPPLSTTVALAVGGVLGVLLSRPILAVVTGARLRLTSLALATLGAVTLLVRAAVG